MEIEFPSIESALSNKTILLITNRVSSNSAARHILTSYSPDVLLPYQQAGWVLGARVVEFPLDLAITHLSGINRIGEFDLVVNLSTGYHSISLEGLIPALSEYQNTIIFPTNLIQQVISEEKLISKHLASISGFNSPRTISLDELKDIDFPIIIKPIFGGDSIGIQKISPRNKVSKIPNGTFAEEFIDGDDVTVHVLYSHSSKKYHVLDCFRTDEKETAWINRSQKLDASLLFGTAKNFNRTRVGSEYIENRFIEVLQDFLHKINTPYIARIDLRAPKKHEKIDIDNTFFLEVNAMPTISHANDWWAGIQKVPSFQKDSKIISRLEQMPIHPAAKSLAFLFQDFYVQSLSMANESL